MESALQHPIKIMLVVWSLTLTGCLTTSGGPGKVAPVPLSDARIVEYGYAKFTGGDYEDEEFMKLKVALPDSDWEQLREIFRDEDSKSLKKILKDEDLKKLLKKFKVLLKSLKGEARGDYVLTRHILPRSDDTMGDGNVIMADMYMPPGTGKRPVIMALPVLGGRDNQFSHLFARYFAERGFAVVIVHRQQSYKEIMDPKKINLAFRQIILDHRQVVDWIELQDDLDSDNIGIFGISFGGIKALLVASMEPRIKVCVAALAGANLPYVLVYSHQEGVEEAIAEIIEKEGLTKEELFVQLQAEITVDPLHYVKHLIPGKVLLFHAAFDTVIPDQSRRELTEAFVEKPKRVILPTGHITAFAYVLYVEYRALKFFRKNLDAAAE